MFDRGVRRLRARLAAAALGLAIALGGLVAAGPAGAATDGSWSVTATPSDVRAVHVAVLRSGKVLLVAGSGNNRDNFTAGSFKTSVWDPANGSLTPVATPWDAFCSGHAFMADGRLLVAGGTVGYPSSTQPNSQGSKKAYLFDPTTQTYTAAPDMHLARWYPTVTQLGDGRQFVLSGLDEAGKRTRDFEIFDGTSWTNPSPAPAAYPYQPMYPALHLMRDGRLFYSGVNTFGSHASDFQPGLWNITNNAYKVVPGLTDDGRRDQGASVMLPPAQDQRVMVMGGGFQSVDVDATASTAIADLKQPNPSFTPGPPMDAAKMYVNAVVLPDSTVFESGGGTKSIQFDGTPVLSAQIFNPKTNAWRKVASPTVGRLYHSSAVLLPDGRVATFGSNPKTSFEMRIEVFTPPYLQTGTARPTVTGGETEFRYGDYGAFRTTQAAAITSVVLVRPAATTHQSDPNQRLVDVPFAKTSNGIAVTMPTERNLAPPGWYMLFAVDANGVPSVAKWVHLDGASAKPHGGYVLDGFGGLHPIALTGAAAARPVTNNAYWLGWDIARGVARRGTTGGYVLDGYGGLHPFSTAGAVKPPVPKGSPYWWGWDIARSVAVLPDRTGGYVLDGYGGIHPFRIGSGPMPPAVSGAPYWAGQDRARGITLLADGTGGYVVDSGGSLYPFRLGSNPAPPKPARPYAPGAAGAPVRGVAMQPNDAAGFTIDGVGGLHGFGVAGGTPLGVTGAPSTFGWVIIRGLAIGP
jgi:hypothetical protein